MNAGIRKRKISPFRDASALMGFIQEFCQKGRTRSLISDPWMPFRTHNTFIPFILSPEDIICFQAWLFI
jgi:hypothetical protein